MKILALLGSTGSIGTGVLDVVRQFPGQYKIAGLAAGRNVDLLSRQVLEFSPELAAFMDGHAIRNHHLSISDEKEMAAAFVILER
ncbi:MAG: hypothetical protein Q8K43_07110 [Sulfurimicrobium sp.]|nr:hypothetical protein [Sulfurimicrobium sp.]